MTTSALKRRSFLQGSLLAAAVIGSTPAVAAEAAKPKFDESFDVIVVGGGHAGTEAAGAAARMGLCGGTMRLPMTPLTSSNEAVVESALRTSGLI